MREYPRTGIILRVRRVRLRDRCISRVLQAISASVVKATWATPSASHSSAGQLDRKPWKGLGPGVLRSWSRMTATPIEPYIRFGSIALRPPCLQNSRLPASDGRGCRSVAERLKTAARDHEATRRRALNVENRSPRHQTFADPVPGCRSVSQWPSLTLLNQVPSAQACSSRQDTWGDAAEGLCASPLQAGGLLRGTPNEPADGARPGCRDRDSAQATLAEGWSY